MTDITLEGKVAFISGASKGIGVAAAQVLASAGASLALTARDETGLQDTARVARDQGVSVWTRTAELGDATELRTLGTAALDDLGRIDILVNNAGITMPQSILDLGLDEWHATFDVNLLAPVLLAQAFAPGMIERGHGKIINVSSRAALGSLADNVAYCSSKAALVAVTRVMAIEFGPHNVQANCVAPTVTLTPMARRIWTPGPRTDAKLARIPAGRFAEADDVAKTILYLASPLSDFVNGTTIPVDGGEGAR